MLSSITIKRLVPDMVIVKIMFTGYKDRQDMHKRIESIITHIPEFDIPAYDLEAYDDFEIKPIIMK